ESQAPNEGVASRPPSPPWQPPVLDDAVSLARFELEDEDVERGPESWVPTVRKDLSQLTAPVPLAQYMRKRSPDGRLAPRPAQHPLPPDPNGSFIHCTCGLGATCWGGEGVLNVWDPSTETFEDHSVMQVGLQNYDRLQTQAVEAGWIVCEQLNGDALPHLF